MTPKETISTIDHGRLKALAESLTGLGENCVKCDHFNPNIRDPKQGYRCRCTGSCPDATVHPHLKSYWHWRLGWATEDDHRANIGRLS